MSDESTASSPEPEQQPTEQHEGFIDRVEHAAHEVEEALHHNQNASDELNESTEATADDSHHDDAPASDVVAPEADHVDNDASNAVSVSDEHTDEHQDDQPTERDLNELWEAVRRAGQPNPKRVVEALKDAALQRDPHLQISLNKFIARQDYTAETTTCPVCQAEFNPGTPAL